MAVDERGQPLSQSARVNQPDAQVHFGAAWPESFVGVLRGKLGHTALHRKIALEGARFTPQEGLQLGLVDYVVAGDTEAVLAKAVAVAETASALARLGSYGLIKVRGLARERKEVD